MMAEMGWVVRSAWAPSCLSEVQQRGAADFCPNVQNPIRRRGSGCSAILYSFPVICPNPRGADGGMAKAAASLSFKVSEFGASKGYIDMLVSVFFEVCTGTCWNFDQVSLPGITSFSPPSLGML